jgi:uncharacterized protein YciI
VSPRFAYFYLMKDEPTRVRAAVSRHVSHWRRVRLAGYLGGPFEDKTGGLITFEAGDISAAREAVHGDPFAQDGLLDSSWLKEWRPE